MRIVRFLALISPLLWLLGLAAQVGGQDLRVFTTAHYRIHTDLDPDLSDDLGARMDVMYDEYARRLSIFDPSDDSASASSPVPRLEVYLVHTQEKYLHLAGITMAGTGGAFNASRHLLAAFLDGQGRDALRRTLQHEAFHQFAAQYIGKNIPIWLNEGLAQVFEEGIWTGNSFILGQVPPRRLRQLHQDIDQGTLIDFSRLLNMTGPQWAAHWHDPAACATQYNQAWAITHFLIYATNDATDDARSDAGSSGGTPKYRARLIEMLKLLHDGEDGESAFRDAFSSNIDGFRGRFLEYAGSLAATPQTTLIENQSVLADFFVEMNRLGRSFTSFEDFRDACIKERWHTRYRRGNVQWESNPDPSVYFSDSSGRPFDDDQEHFELSGERPLPDMVCRCPGLLGVRTRFYTAGEKIEHETIVEAGQ